MLKIKPLFEKGHMEHSSAIQTFSQAAFSSEYWPYWLLTVFSEHSLSKENDCEAATQISNVIRLSEYTWNAKINHVQIECRLFLHVKQVTASSNLVIWNFFLAITIFPKNKGGITLCRFNRPHQCSCEGFGNWSKGYSLPLFHVESVF